MSNFDPNAIIRGAQLTVVGAIRALTNPELFKYEHYRQAVYAVGAGIIIRIVVAIPIIGVKVLLWILSFFIDFEHSTWDDSLVDGLGFLQDSVLQIPFVLMSLMRYITPTLDQMFMDSLKWVDRTYYKKHQSDDPSKLRATYYNNLVMYSTLGDSPKKKSPMHAGTMLVTKYGRRAVISLTVYLLSFLPLIGRFVLPAASFYTFRKAVGPGPATVIFGTGIFLPRRYLVTFLQTYFASRSLMRELLEPYLSRIHYTREQRRLWFLDREGVLFGFGVGFYMFLKIPLLGVLIYGIAEASTAYLITKITEPPPPPAYSDKFIEDSVRWQNKHELLNLSLLDLDALNASMKKTEPMERKKSAFPDKQYS